MKKLLAVDNICGINGRPNISIKDPDLIINIQCDEPYVKQNHFKKIIELFNNQSTQIGTLICPLRIEEIKDRSIVKAKVTNNFIAKEFYRSIKKQNLLYKHLGIYAYRRKTLLELDKLNTVDRELKESLEQLRWVENNYIISCALITESLISINTKNDLKKVLKNNS